MVGFEPRISSVGSDYSANCATTIAFSHALVKKLDVQLEKVDGDSNPGCADSCATTAAVSK